MVNLMAGLTVGIAGSGIQIISLGPCLSILLSLEFTSFSSRPFPCVKKDGAEQFQAYIILTASEAKERRPESLPLHHTGHHKWPIFPSLGRISTAQWGGKSSTTNRRTETTHPIFFFHEKIILTKQKKNLVRSLSVSTSFANTTFVWLERRQNNALI